jgi:ubiquitin-protein ligase
MIDLKNLRDEHPDGLDAAPDPKSILKWYAKIRGPPGTRWEGETLEAVLIFPESYPANPPRVSFLKDICHPNVSRSGRVCVDVLQHKWNPDSDVLSILISLQVFLASPNLRSVANREAVRVLAGDPRYSDLFSGFDWEEEYWEECDFEEDFDLWDSISDLEQQMDEETYDRMTDEVLAESPALRRVLEAMGCTAINGQR